MFLVKDKITERLKKIDRFLQEDPPIAVLIASAHLEWVLRRSIISLSDHTNRSIRDVMEKDHLSGLNKYKKVWTRLVSNRFDRDLSNIIKNWDCLIKSYQLRHDLIHGRESCSRSYAEPRIKDMVEAASYVTEYAKINGHDLEKRLKIRKK